MNVRGHFGKSLFNICAILSGHFKKWNIKTLRQFLSFFKRHFSFFFKIAFISYQKLINVFSCKSFNLSHPLPNIIKRIPVCHIIHYDDSMCSSIIRGSKSSKSLLTCGVPLNIKNAYNLHLDDLVVKFYCFYLEIYSYSVEEVFSKRIFLRKC